MAHRGRESPRDSYTELVDENGGQPRNVRTQMDYETSETRETSESSQSTAEDVAGESANVRAKNVCFSKEMVPSKLVFVFEQAASSSAFSFLTLLYVSSGLTAATAGLSRGIGNCFALVAGPVWGALIDSSQHPTFVTMSLWLATTITMCSKPFLVTLVSKWEINVTCLNGTVYNATTTATQAECRHLLNVDVLFYTVLGIEILSSVFFSGLGTCIEGVIVNIIYTRKTKPSYGQQKAFAPIGSALGSFLSGVAIDYYKPVHLSPYTAGFYVYIPFTLMVAPLLYILANQADWRQRSGRKRSETTSVRKHLVLVLKNTDNVVFLMSVVTSGVLYCLYFEFISLFMKDTMNSTKTIISLTIVVAMISEIFIYPFSSKIIKCFGGPIICVFIGIFTYVPRLLLTSYCTNAWLMLPIQLFHGIGLSLAWSAMVEHAYVIFPKEITTTALGILRNLHFMGPSIITNIVGGQIYRRYGGGVLYRGAAVVSGGWCVVMVLYFGVCKLKKTRRTYTTVFDYGSIEHKVES